MKCAAALILAFAAAASAELVTFSAPRVTNGWAASPIEDDTAHVTFTLVVKEQGEKEIKEIAKAVSDPKSAKYGQFLTQRQVDKITAPKAEDMAAVVDWLEANDIEHSIRGVSNVVVRATIRDAARLLKTQFRTLSHSENDYSIVRAAHFALPAEVSDAIATHFFLHGLPLPRSTPVAASIMPGQPVAVTPEVLSKKYGVSGVKTTGSTKNRQAVAEFQGQFMNSTDLANMFKALVKDYTVGTDDVVYKFVGKHEENSGGVEAELDIQYIMGLNAGIKTEFWEFPGMDFAGDLNQWTSNLTSKDDVPIVHSVSYGWQGNLSQVNAKAADLKAINTNLAKMAAKGISVMISSGDSGSGYAASNSQCMGRPGKQGEALTGTTMGPAREVQEAGQCCEMAGSHGWTFVEAKKLGADGDYKFVKAEFHAEMGSGVIKNRDEYILNGDITKEGGDVKVTCLNGSFPDSTISFGPAVGQKGAPEVRRNVTATLKGEAMTGEALFIAFPGQPAECLNIEWHAKTGGISIWERGPNPPPPPPPGKCTIYSKVTGTKTADDKTFSGSPPKAPKAPTLWASWPASSPWVTAVGATRFVGQVVTGDEMATDQFGSGGGFSTDWEQSPDATYQSEAVAKYLKTVEQSSLPPAASFDAKARATPDVSALGEGYQVMVGGHFEGVGGTSASSPMFAGLVSLLNEARFAAGKKQMGFLNPFLYQNEDAFTDIVLGSNKVGRGGQPLPYGFNCSKGWDPATGLGTPKFQALLKAALGPDQN